MTDRELAEKPDLTSIVIGGRTLRDLYCEICQPAMKGSIATTTWHAASSGCERTRDIHCSCRPCRSIAP